MRSATTLGLEQNGSNLRACLLSLKNKIPICLSLWNLPIQELPNEGTLIERLSATPVEAGSFSLKPLQRAQTVSKTAGDLVLLRKISLGKIKKNQISSVLPFEVEEQLPYPIEEAVLDWLPTQDPEKITAFAIREQELKEALESWKKHQLDVEKISTTAAALTAFANQVLPKEGLRLLLHIGEEESTLVLLENGFLQNAFSTPQGTEKERDLLIKACCRMAFALKKGVSQEQRDTLKFSCTGPGSLDLSLISALEEGFGVKTEPPKEALGLTTNQLQSCSAAIGLALSSLESTNENGSIDLRKNKHAFSKPWRHIWRHITVLLGLCLATTFFIGAGSHFWAKKELAKLRSDYSSLTHFTGNSLLEQEVAFRKKQRLTPISEKTTDQELLNSLTLSSLKARLPFIKERLNQQESPIPLDVRLPKVRDFLGWIANTKEFSDKSLILENLDYSMVKRPEKTKIKERYSAKVSLDFTAKSSREARAFYDSLLEPNAFVDPSAEVKWSTSPGKFHVSFLLKDQTRYPKGVKS